MKLSIVELRDMVAEAVRRTVREAKKAPKLPAAQSEESVVAQRDRQVRGLPGYAHSTPLDMSKPLGPRNLVRRQGASNIGNWTSEATDVGRFTRPGRVSELLDILERSVAGLRRLAGQNGEHDVREAQSALRELRQTLQAMQIEGRGTAPMAENAIRKLVRMIVAEEIRVRDEGLGDWTRTQIRKLDPFRKERPEWDPRFRHLSGRERFRYTSDPTTQDDPPIPQARALPPRKRR